LLEPYYVLLTGSGLIFLIVTGLRMLRQRAGKGTARRWHRVLGVIFALPLALTAATGMAYEAGQTWFDISEETADLLMSLHEGGWLGKKYKVYYVLVTGCGLLSAGFFGLALLRRKRAASS